MTPITDPKLIRKELQKLGYKAHGKKCRVVLDKPTNKPVEAIIHCKGVPKDELMRWYFCQDESHNSCLYNGDQHGKKYSWCFLDDDDQDGVYSFEWIDEKVKVPTYTINPMTVTIDGETYTKEELADEIICVEKNRDGLNAYLKVARQALKKIS